MVGSSPLGSLFGRSPLKPIQEHMQVVNRAAQMLPELLQASSSGDWDRAKELQKEIVAAEREADKLKRSVRSHLPNSLFLPVPRSDLLNLVSIQDAIANTAKDISLVIMGRNMCFPESLQATVQEFTEACCATAAQAFTAVQELDELLEVGFTGREVKRVEGMLKELDKLERRTDKQAESIRGKLFKLESELPPVDVMFYYKVLGLLGTLADYAETAGDRLQVLLAK
jgi:predicted phosphate transport protein (TIGR00153 family)